MIATVSASGWLGAVCRRPRTAPRSGFISSICVSSPIATTAGRFAWHTASGRKPHRVLLDADDSGKRVERLRDDWHIGRRDVDQVREPQVPPVVERLALGPVHGQRRHGIARGRRIPVGTAQPAVAGAVFRASRPARGRPRVVPGQRGIAIEVLEVRGVDAVELRDGELGAGLENDRSAGQDATDQQAHEYRDDRDLGQREASLLVTHFRNG